MTSINTDELKAKFTGIPGLRKLSKTIEVLELPGGLKAEVQIVITTRKEEFADGVDKWKGEMINE